MIWTDRTRIETHEKCPRLRFWSHEAFGRGLEKTDNLKLDARIGSWVHAGIEDGLNRAATGDTYAARQVSTWAGDEFVADCKAVLGASLLDQPPQLQHDIIEASQIVTALVYAWLRTKASRLLADGDVLTVEKELEVDFTVATGATVETVRLMSRPDIIWRRHEDGNIFIRNLKTVRKADDRWREKWALDQQTLSEPLAVDAWLAEQFTRSMKGDTTTALYGTKIYTAESDAKQCGGVIVDGLVTGEVLFDKYRGLFYHNSPLIYGWVQEGEELQTAAIPRCSGTQSTSMPAQCLTS